MLRNIIIGLVLLAAPFVIYLAVEHGQIRTVSFEEAVKLAEGKTETEQVKKIMVKGNVIVDEQHPFQLDGAMANFYMRDASMTTFYVSYDGEDPAEELRHMQSIAVAGHAHEGQPPWFHAKDIVKY